jgi:hypothetical protein
LIEVFNATLTADDDDKTACDDNPLLFAFAASADPDTMYLHEAMKQPDRNKFMEAMQKEINDHTENGHWRIVPQRYANSPSCLVDETETTDLHSRSLQMEGQTYGSWW